MNPLRKITILLGAVVLGLLLWRTLTLKKPMPALPEAPSDFGGVADFSFTDQTNKPFGTKELQGKIWVADFIFTTCMGPCPVITAKMAELQKELTRPDLMFVSFSVDPEHDTPKALATYAATYGADNARWRFLTGPKDKIYALIRESFHLAVEKQGSEKPSVNDILHSLSFVLVSKDGRILGYFNSGDPEAMKNIREKIKVLG